VLHITLVWGDRSHGLVDVHRRFSVICCLHRREALVPLKRCYVFTRLYGVATLETSNLAGVLKIGTVNWVELAENRNLGLRFYPFSVLRGFNMESEVLAFAVWEGTLTMFEAHPIFSLVGCRSILYWRLS